MPAVSEDVWRILYAVSRYLFPLLALILVFLVFFYVLSEGRSRRERVRGLPGFGTVGELIVLSGGPHLDMNTWFPVPREGLLGSVRSCDLVIPCDGVRPKHLDFVWQDGVGLLLRPHTGCEAIVDGVLLTCRSDASAAPLRHGSVLQIGSAVLRLHLFASLDNTVAPAPSSSETPLPGFVPDPGYGAVPPYGPFQPDPGPQGMIPPVPEEAFLPPQMPDPAPLPPDSRGISPQPESPAPVSPSRPRRSDRWKEEMGE